MVAVGGEFRNYRCRCTRQGLPTARVRAGTSIVTTLPAPIVAPSPIVTPGITRDPAPIHTLFPTRIGAARMAPLGAENEVPPVANVPQIDRLRRLDEHKRARHQHFLDRPRVVGGVGRNLGKCDVPGVTDELLK